VDSTPTSNITIAQRSSWQVMRDVIAALFVRELKTRFGSSRLGYFWALAEPMAHILVFSGVFTLIGRQLISGVDIPLIVMTGIMPYLYFSRLVTGLSNGIQANTALLVYRQVQPIDPLLTRFLIDLAAYWISLVVLLILFAWLGFNVVPHDPLSFIAVNVVVSLLGFGIALSLCSALLYWSDTPKLLSVAMRPMFFMSGIFFTTAMIPTKYWVFLDWNPMLHLIELNRIAFFESYHTAFPNWTYPVVVALLANALGLMLYRVNRDKFVADD